MRDIDLTVAVQALQQRMLDAHIDNRRDFLQHLLNTSDGYCPDCDRVILDCWEQIVDMHRGWFGMRASCSGAETWRKVGADA